MGHPSPCHDLFPLHWFFLFPRVLASNVMSSVAKRSFICFGSNTFAVATGSKKNKVINYLKSKLVVKLAFTVALYYWQKDCSVKKRKPEQRTR